MLIRTIGVQVETYPSAPEFLTANRIYPDVSWQTFSCQVMNGVQLQKKLTELSSTLPIIFITARGDVPTAVSAVTEWCRRLH